MRRMSRARVNSPLIFAGIEISSIPALRLHAPAPLPFISPLSAATRPSLRPAKVPARATQFPDSGSPAAKRRSL